MYILTFDVEDWFHLLDHPETSTEKQWLQFESRFETNLNRVLSITSDCNVKATFFCLGWIAERYPELIKRLASEGHEIACHSSSHQLAYNQTPEEFREDLLRAKNQILAATGLSVKTFRIPGFSLTNESLWALNILSEEGFSIDCSVFPAVRGHGGLPQFKSDKPCRIKTTNGYLKEFPLNTINFFGNRIVFSGGGYFRLFPYFILKRLFRNSNYTMTYFHPRDFDPQQPIVPNLSYYRRFKSYVGLRSCEEKLRKILNEFDFVDVQTALSTIDWDKTPIIDINHKI